MFFALLAQTLTPTPGSSEPSGVGSLIIFLPIVGLLFWMMRKQGKQRREHMDLVQSVQIGDQIETVAGMFGRVTRSEDDVIWVELAPTLEIKMARGAVRRKVQSEGL